MSRAAYRFSLASGLEPYRPEIEHALLFVERCYGLVRTPLADVHLHYGPEPPPGSIAVPACLFPDMIEARADGVRLTVRAAISLRDSHEVALLPRASPGLTSIGYDAIGLIFLLISRIEERSAPHLDRYERFPLDCALLQPENGRLAPWADAAAHDLARAITGNPDPKPATTYGVKFTHDVDMLKGYHRPLDPLRLFAGDIIRRRRSPQDAAEKLATSYFGGEPYWCARRMMDLSERHGLASHFYFMGPSNNRMDSPYVLRMPQTLRRLVAEIAGRGHVVGFHPGFTTYADEREWQAQRSGLERVIDHHVDEGRQHVLRYAADVTPRLWAKAGMRLDCTLAYPEATGFRNGTCRPVAAYDLVNRQTLPLMQLATAVMEFGMFGGKYRDMSDEAAMADALWACEQCRRYQGTFTLLFHTSIRELRLWRWFDALLERAVARA